MNLVQMQAIVREWWVEHESRADPGDSEGMVGGI